MVTVAIDATPLLGQRTGIGVSVAGFLGALEIGNGLDVVAYGQTGTGWRELPAHLPSGVRAARWPMPAAVVQRIWARADLPPIQVWTGRLDVVHGTNFVVPPARRAARLATVNDLTTVRYPEMCAPASLAYPHLIARAVAGGASVHTPSRFVAEEVKDQFGVPDDRVHVIPWAVTAAGALTAGGASIGGAPAEPGTGIAPYILGLGTVEPRKDYPLLVRAFDLLADRQPDVRLVIAGKDGWGSDALHTAIQASPHRDRISRQGWVSDPRALLASAAVLAYPSVYEGFGFPPLEAMSVDTPVVTTAAGSLPEVVGDAALVVPSGDAPALAAALLRAVEDDQQRAALIEAGRRRVAEFSWARTAGALRELYFALAGG